MTGIWIVDQGDFAVQASLMVGGYLAAAALLTYLPARTNLHHAGRLGAALLIVLAALLPALSPLGLIIGAAASIALWATATWLTGPRMAIVHLVLLAIASFLVGAQSVTNNWIDYAATNPVETARIGVYIAAFAIVTAPASYAIAWLLNRLDLRSPSAGQIESSRAGDSSSNGQQIPPITGAAENEPDAPGETHPALTNLAPPGRGRVIGIMERLMLLTLGLIGQWQAAGLIIIAAKTIARFRNLENRDFAEYYLVGTLTSLLIATLAAALALAIT